MARKKVEKSAGSDKQQRRQQAQQTRRQQKKAEKLKRKLKIIGVLLAIVLVGIGGVLLFSDRTKLYPPISFAGQHAETWPAQRISTVPIPLLVQAHIIEHVPGGEPGVLLEYNCTRFKCESDLVAKLTDIAKRYSYVYLAPYPQMGAKIALAALDRRLVLDRYDEAKIIAFLGP